MPLYFPLSGAGYETQGHCKGKNERVVFWSSLGGVGIKERKGKKEAEKANEKKDGIQ